ncbi:hypothetical protein D9757_000417 [Collybiopsis confluens]|uniref:Uncharacterized protein n=1 Tax=Collybiopsis confluens TaxID=2823264 RepID=A0A8H5MH91_9AGAR|nr:hypothetical protein D9757_000417 [Collybiopsis confluens]
MLRSLSLFQIEAYYALRTGQSNNPRLTEIGLNINTTEAWIGLLLPNARQVEIRCPKLEVFEVFPVSQLVQFLEQHPSISDLNLVILNPFSGLFAQIMRALFPEPEATALCPHLQSLTIDVEDPYCFLDLESGSEWLEQMIQVVQRRTRRVVTDYDSRYSELTHFQLITKSDSEYQTDMQTAVGKKLPNKEDRASFRMVRGRLLFVGVEVTLVWDKDITI